mmetsp:Transcript_59251/g.152488  ORF Transcript_59251/g.152488 Transcript_59251/m.152488 type:complete len:371 (-) Transcript_59251:2-1114(-)
MALDERLQGCREELLVVRRPPEIICVLTGRTHGSLPVVRTHECLHHQAAALRQPAPAVAQLLECRRCRGGRRQRVPGPAHEEAPPRREAELRSLRPLQAQRAVDLHGAVDGLPPALQRRPRRGAHADGLCLGTECSGRSPGVLDALQQAERSAGRIRRALRCLRLVVRRRQREASQPLHLGVATLLEDCARLRGLLLRRAVRLDDASAAHVEEALGPREQHAGLEVLVAGTLRGRHLVVGLLRGCVQGLLRARVVASVVQRVRLRTVASDDQASCVCHGRGIFGGLEVRQSLLNCGQRLFMVLVSIQAPLGRREEHGALADRARGALIICAGRIVSRQAIGVQRAVKPPLKHRANDPAVQRRRSRGQPCA